MIFSVLFPLKSTIPEKAVTNNQHSYLTILKYGSYLDNYCIVIQFDSVRNTFYKILLLQRLLKFRTFGSLYLPSWSICPDFTTKKKLGFAADPYLLGQTPQFLLFFLMASLREGFKKKKSGIFQIWSDPLTL